MITTLIPLFSSGKVILKWLWKWKKETGAIKILQTRISRISEMPTAKNPFIEVAVLHHGMDRDLEIGVLASSGA